MDDHRCLPITLKIPAGAPALVVGGGTVAASKVDWLLRCGVVVDVVAEVLCDRLRVLSEAGQLRWLAGRFDAAAVPGHVLALAATDDPVVNEAVQAAAVCAGIPVNVADDPERSTFYVPAMVTRGALQVSVSTGGRSPSLAVRLRQDFDDRLPGWYADYTVWLGAARTRVRAALADPVARRRALGYLASEAVADRLATFPEPDRPAAFTALVYGALGAAAGPPEGRVWLVGAGPGDPGLITLRGLDCLKRADAVLHDGLVNPVLLGFARRDAELVDTSKRAGCRRFDQGEINGLMVALARAGKTVCRLKGGDPCVFGRGGEEALHLAAHGVPFEFVPGVSAAIAAPAAAGIPVTHRDHASYFQVVTGHEDPAKTESRVNWQDLGSSRGTLIFLMGAGRVGEICRRLLAHGKAPETPVAVISRGTLPDQLVLETTLAAGAADGFPAAAAAPRPALIVVGDVVSLRHLLA
jgi:uroporphyrin-III C-methyltransferase/precorrin-2 dehydrogenase/sirohydrochlorin ferrochelatase